MPHPPRAATPSPTPLLRRVYPYLAPLPAMLWGLALRYLARLEGWGAWGAAAPVLLPILALSAALGLVGLALIRRARRRGEPLGALVPATAVACVVAAYYAWRGLA